MIEVAKLEEKEAESTEGLMTGEDVLELIVAVGADTIDREAAEKVAQEINEAAKAATETGELLDARQFVLENLSLLASQNASVEATQK